MTALVFPSSPTSGQQYTAAGRTWEWDGLTWFGLGVDAAALLYASICCGRLTLAENNAVYSPTNKVSVSGEDTGADTITVTAHGWVVGTMVKSGANSGGITAETTYYVGNPTTNTISLHTTVAAAEAGTPKLNITGAVTADITPFGIARTSAQWTPYKGAQIALYDGTTWLLVSFSETSLALGTLTSGKNYDVFGYVASGALALELSAAWASDSARTDALTTQNGVYVKSGAPTRRYLGTIRTTSTTTTEDSCGGIISNVGGKRFVWNYYNRVARNMAVIDTTDTWAYTTDTWRQARATAGNQVEFVIGVPEDIVVATLAAAASIGNNTRSAKVSIGWNSTSVASRLIGVGYNGTANGWQASMTVPFAEYPTYGYTYLAWLEKGPDGSATWIGDNSGVAQCGMVATVQG